MKERLKTISAIRAFTLIELLIIVLVMGILAGISIPSFKGAFSNIELTNFSRELQSFMNYLHQRSIIEEKPITMNIDAENKTYNATIKDATAPFKAYSIPAGISVNSSQQNIVFYPDGSIDKITIELANQQEESVKLTTKGVFGSVKIEEK